MARTTILLKKSLILFFFLLWGGLLPATETCSSLLNEPEKTKAYGELRVKALRSWDKFVSWTLSPKNQSLPLQPGGEKTFTLDSEEILHFDKNYGYFSIYHPMVGLVTKQKIDLEVAQSLLDAMGHMKVDPEQLRIATDEVLSKVVAYRNMKKGMHLRLPNGDVYIVDEVIDLWRGMPAFGLLPEKKGGIPILLFRGTDLSLTSERGWASILSDLDTTGTGHSTFLRGQDEVHAWLGKIVGEYQPPRLLGFSLGGVFVYYTLIYENEWVNHDPQYPSVAFNPPGVSIQLLKKWKGIPKDKRPPLETYVMRGDFVSQIGFFFSKMWELSLPEPLQVIESHVTLTTLRPKFQINPVDVFSTNENRK